MQCCYLSFSRWRVTADVDVIVETIGGYGVALKIANGALGRGVSLVTANKARH